MSKSLRQFIRWLGQAISSPGVGGLLARGSLASLVVRATATGLLFGMHVLLARILGVDSYGRFAYVTTWIQALALFSGAGMDSASSRFVAEYRAKDAPSSLASFLRYSRKLTVTVSILVTAGLLVAIYALGPSVQPELRLTFLWGAFLLPPLALLEVRSGAIRGLKKIALARLPPDIIRPLIISGIAIVLCLSGHELRAPSAMAISIAAALAALVAAELYIGRRIDGTHAKRRPAQRREWVRVGLHLVLVAGFTLILAQADTLMLGAIRGTTTAGVYVVTYRLSTFVSFVLYAMASMAGPQIAELHALGSKRELQRILTLTARVALASGLVVFLLLLFLGSSLLALFGDEFREGAPVLVILALGQIVHCAGGAVGTLMSMTGNQGRAAWVLAGSAFLNVLLNAVLIPRFGMTGAAAATAISLVTWKTALVGVSVRKLGLDPSPVGRRSS